MAIQALLSKKRKVTLCKWFRGSVAIFLEVVKYATRVIVLNSRSVGYFILKIMIAILPTLVF